MKNAMKPMNLKMFFALIVLNLVQIVLWAQEETTTSTKKVDVSVESSENWYASPWVWVIGAAVFILLLVALLGGKSRSTDSSTDRVTVTKTVERDTDV
ncbi:MAG TPA: hypothetical protein VFQ73_15990 [Flavisolibacter sp.]|nr:hypothetical protein [Flavisolibacter sp.]